MRDLISRQEILNKLNKLDQQELYLPCHFKEYVIDEVPSVPQKTGQWKYTDNAVWDATEINDGQQLKLNIVSAKCSACDKWAEQVNKYTGYMTYNYCPNCGAKMEGEAK